MSVNNPTSFSFFRGDIFAFFAFLACVFREEWRDVSGDDRYQVSNWGRVRSRCIKGTKSLRAYGDWRIVAGAGQPNRYRWIMVRRGNTLKKAYIHRLVLETFVGPCPASHEARHWIVNDPSISCVWNLQWGTATENQSDRAIHGTGNKGSRHGLAKLDEVSVRQILGRFHDGDTITSIARDYGVTRRTVARICRRKGWLHVSEILV